MIIETIMTYLSETVILIASMIAYVFLIAYLLPKFLIVPQYRADTIRDRGIKKYLFENGRAIVCEPSPISKQYVEQYIISSKDGNRFFQCRFNSSVNSIKYRILTFDANDKPVCALDVNEPSVKEDLSRSVSLPPRTAYVSVEIIEVNQIRVAKETSVFFSPVKLLLFFVSALVCTLIESLLIHNTVVTVANFIAKQTSDIIVESSISLIVPIILGVACSVLVFMTHYSKNVRIFEKTYLRRKD